MDKILVTLFGIGLIGAVYMFFFGKRDEAVEAGAALTVLVEGGYKPSLIKLKQGQSTKLTFIRRDSNSCLEDVIIPDFKVKQYLPLNKPVTITLSPANRGTFSIHCGMNMFHGKIEVT